MNPAILSIAIVCLFSIHATSLGQDLTGGDSTRIVSRDLSNPETNLWQEGDYPTAVGSIESSDGCPTDAGGTGGSRALRLKVKYPAASHGGWSCRLSGDGGKIPGRLQKVSLWLRLGDDHPKTWGLSANFKDAEGHYFSIGVPFSNIGREWTKRELAPPEKIKAKNQQTGKDEQVPISFPVEFTGFSLDNWFDRNNPKEVERIVDVYDFRVFSDVSGMVPDELPASISLSFPVAAGIFYSGEDCPQIRISAGSWRGEQSTVSGRGRVTSALGESASFDIPAMTVLDSATALLPLPLSAPGAYTIETNIEAFGKRFHETHRYAVVPHPPALTAEQRLKSPYGVNVHGGGFVGYDLFERIGMVWLRDYAFDYNWMNRARGRGDFAGWPNYPKIVATGDSHGMETLPCLKSAMRFDKKQDWPKSPTDEWRRDIARIVAAFPSLHCFELDNEKDEQKDGFPESYAAYHRAFGEIMQAVRPDALAIQEGAAGIDVAMTRKLVLDGSMDGIDVCNGHRYCGVDAPEYSKSNLNTGRGEDRKTFLRDLWRHWKAAACADGHDRQLWLTEWGWDTRAGQIVSEIEQAAYLQREWVLGMGNGIDKMFWYYHYDENTDTPSVFFDGCGLFDRYREPKPSAAAFAALRSFLPADMTYLGYANLGPNHMAHILKTATGSLIAMAFKIRHDDKLGPLDPTEKDLTIDDPSAKRVTDMFGRTLKPGRRTLGIDPIWYFDLDPSCDWVKQCSMDVLSDFFVRNVSGEPIEIEVANPDKCHYEVAAPSGWSVVRTKKGFSATGPTGVKRGAERLVVTGTSGGVKKSMPIEIDIVPQAFVKSHAAQFDGSFAVDVVNQSGIPRRFEIRADVPEGWKVEPLSQTTKILEPDGKTTLHFKLIASSPVPADETRNLPQLSVVNPDLASAETNARSGLVIDTAPIIPRELTIKRVSESLIAVDGNASDWTSQFQVPAWMLGPRGNAEKSRIFIGWAETGLYMCFDIEDSQCKTSDPRSFWRAADCVEVQLSAPGATFDESAGWTPHDHQFWFCPLAEECRVYSGLWANCPEQAASLPDGTWAHYDMKDVSSALGKTASGYVMELFIPASRIEGWNNPKSGDTAGLMLSVAVQGFRDAREIYWPASKTEGAVKKPWTWAKVHLVD